MQTQITGKYETDKVNEKKWNPVQKRSTTIGPRLKFHIPGNCPEGLLHQKGKPKRAIEIRHRLKIMALNIGSLPGNKDIVTQYINDNDVHVAVIVESNVTHSKITEVQIKNYTITNTSCREDNRIKGGGGGGVLIYVYNSIPC